MAKINWKSVNEQVSDYKKQKDKEMNFACKYAILHGFKHELRGVDHHISYDQEAQINFQETYRLFENNIITSVMWTTTLNGGKVRVPLDKEDFYDIYFASVRHKLDSISKYRDVITPAINDAKTMAELESITWGKFSPPSSPPELNRDMTLENRIEQNEISQAQGDIEILSYIMMGGLM